MNKFYNKKVIFIPDYICNESLSLLRKTDAKIIFYDHTLLNKNKLIEEIKSKKADIFLYVNYFGKFNILNKEFLSNIKKYNITLIADNTHCLVSSKDNCSDMEIYSPHKLFGIEDGSIIKFNNKNNYSEFKKYELNKKNYYKYKIIARIINLLVFTAKKKFDKLLVIVILKLTLIIIPVRKHNKKLYRFNFNDDVKFYYSKVDIYKLRRKNNYYIWVNCIKKILPFIKFEKINYTPYLGILNFSNSIYRVKILKKYNALGLPIGTWPDLPPEIINTKSRNKTAISKFENQLTIPLHEDIDSKLILDCTKNVLKDISNLLIYLFPKIIKK